jgi:hypothetical protein
MKSLRHFLFISTAALLLCYAGVQKAQAAVLAANKTKILTMYEYNVEGEPVSVTVQELEEPEAPLVWNFTYNSFGNLDDIVLLRPEFNPYEQMDSDDDGFGRITSVAFYDPDTNEPNSCIYFDYHSLGNLAVVHSGYISTADHDIWRLSWAIEDTGNNVEKIVREKKETTAEDQTQMGIITYYDYDCLGRIIKATTGHSGDTTEYQYDPCDPNRLAAIIEPQGQILYEYDANGWLTQCQHYDANYTCCVQYRETDTGQGSTVEVASNTLAAAADPNYTALGQLQLHYDSNNMLTEIRYTTDESEFSVPPAIAAFQYEYDHLGRVTGVTCTSPSPSEPNLVITLDPNIPDTGSYKVTQYEYDSLNRLIWTLDTDGCLTRTVYHDMLSLDSVPRPMLEIKVDLHAPPKLTAPLRHEYDIEGWLLRSSDLRGHYVIHAEKIIAAEQTPFGGGGQYGLHLGGGGQYFVLGGGGSFGLYGGGGQYFFPLGGGGMLGGMLGPFGFDEYANMDVPIETEKVSVGDDEVLQKIKKKVCKKADSKNTVPIGCKETVEGDLTGDCKVDWYDVALVARDWLEDQSP